MQRDWRQPLLCNKLCNAPAEDIRLIGLSRLIYGNITFRVICRIFFPPLLPFAVQTVQQRFKIFAAAEGQPPLGGIGLRRFFKCPAAYRRAHLADRKHAPLQIDIAPLEPADFAAPQPETARKLNGDLKLRSLARAKKFPQLR